SFEIWHRQVAHERTVHDGVGQRDGGGDEASEDKSEAKQAEGTRVQGKERADAAKKDRASAKAGEGGHSYEVDINNSRVFVKLGSATRLGHPHGVEGKLNSGNITLGAGGELVFDMQSFKADTPDARKKVGLE